MRGRKPSQTTMLSLVAPAQRVPRSHPLRRIKDLADGALAALSATFDAMYAAGGRPSVPPERLLKSTLLMAFYSVRSDRLFCEQLDYNLLFRWFLDMDMVEDSFDHSTFSKNRERLLEHDVAKKFLAEIVERARSAQLMSDDHFTVDGTLIEAWASVKSFRPKGEKSGTRPPPDDPGNPTVNFHGARRGCWLRHRRLRRRVPGARNHAAHRADGRHATTLGGGPPHHSARGVRRKPAHPETSRGDLRLGEDGRVLS